MVTDFEKKVNELVKQEPAYTADAYSFVAEAVTFTVSKLPAHRHVSALELLNGAGEFAVTQYGAVAGQVLNSFGIYKASDVGRLVYLLIGAGVLSASDDDDPEDFNIDFELVKSPVNTEINIKLPSID